jgi:hypothetical protein
MMFSKITKRLPQIREDELEIEGLEEAMAIQPTEQPEKPKLGYLDHNLNGVRSALNFLKSEERRLTSDLKLIQHHLNEIQVSIKGMEAAATIMVPHSKQVHNEQPSQPHD